MKGSIPIRFFICRFLIFCGAFLLHKSHGEEHCLFSFDLPKAYAGKKPSSLLMKKSLKPRIYSPPYSAIVMEAETGKILHNDCGKAIRHPASLTKIMTLYLVFEALHDQKISLQDRLYPSPHAVLQSPSRLGLALGEWITVEQAVEALVTKSANDVAVMLAEHLSGSEEKFSHRMTQKAKALGMTHTVFKNASGLPHKFQVTSALDMAILSRSLQRDFPREYRYFNRQSFSHRGKVHRNHNHLLGKVEGLDGIKTGFIVASGFNLAASAVRRSQHHSSYRLIVVVLGGPNRHWRDQRVEALMEAYFYAKGLSRHPQGQEFYRTLHPRGASLLLTPISHSSVKDLAEPEPSLHSPPVSMDLSKDLSHLIQTLKDDRSQQEENKPLDPEAIQKKTPKSVSPSSAPLKPTPQKAALTETKKDIKKPSQKKKSSKERKGGVLSPDKTKPSLRRAPSQGAKKKPSRRSLSSQKLQSL